MGALGLGIAAPSAVWAQAAPVRFGRVAVDASPLRAKGGGAAAEVIARVLPGLLATSFADQIVAGDTRAPTLVARIDTIYLSLDADLPSVGLNSFGNTDSMEGAGLVVAGRRLIGTTPLRVSLPAGYSGAYYLPDIDVRRITSLCESFASWLRREMSS